MLCTKAIPIASVAVCGMALASAAKPTGTRRYQRAPPTPRSPADTQVLAAPHLKDFLRDGRRGLGLARAEKDVGPPVGHHNMLYSPFDFVVFDVL